MLHSLRQTCRSLAGSPLFSLTTTLSLGLAIGACTAVFSVLRAVYFTPLPYPEADRLVEVRSTQNPAARQPIDGVPADRVLRWSDLGFRTLESLVARGRMSLVLETQSGPARIMGEAVSGDFFPTMGISAQLGRTLGPDDDRPGAAPAVVLSEPLWRERFGREPSVLGRGVTLSGRTYTVIGVMPERFGDSEQAWIPAGEVLAEGVMAAWSPVARLRPGTSAEEATLELSRLAAAELAADSVAYGGMGAAATPLGSWERAAGPAGIWVIGGVVSAVFLLALANLTTLFLLRGAERGRAAAVRLAMGASPGQLGRGLLMEGGVLAAAGAALGLAVAFWGKDVVRTVLGGAYGVPSPPTIDAWVFGLSAGLASLAAVVVGLEPLRLMRRVDVRSLLQGTGTVSSMGPAQRRTRNLLVSAQVALVVVFAGGASMLLVWYGRFLALDVGFDAGRVVQATPDYEARPTTEDEQWAMAAAAAERLSPNPSVDGVTYWRMATQDYPPRPEDGAVFEGGVTEMGARDDLYRYYDVGPDFFRVTGIQIVAGRDFGPADGPSGEAVGIVSERGARIWWPGQDPLGRRLKLGEAGEWITVVGVAEDAQGLSDMARTFSSSGLATLPLLYRAAAQQATPPPGWGIVCGLGCDGVVVAARAAGDPADAKGTLAREMARLAPDLPLRFVDTLLEWQLGGFPGYMASRGREARRNGRLAGCVAAVGLFLALLGIVGVTADAVSRRTREIGLRMALGAEARDVVAAIGRESVLSAALGLAVGVAAILAFTGTLQRLFFSGSWPDLGVSLADPRLLSGVTTAMLLAVLATAGLTARRATRVDPAVALREE